MNTFPIGLGTWKIKNLKETVSYAISCGYRLFDTAWIYHNEEELGNALKNTKLPRTDYQIISKVWFDYVPNYTKHSFIEEDFQYIQLKKRFFQTLKNLKTEYVDMLLLHRPTNEKNDIQAFNQLLELKSKGYVKHLWVSNFPLYYLKKIITEFWEEVEVLENEAHVFLETDDILSYCKEHQIQFIGYSPLGHGHLIWDNRIIDIANKSWLSPAKLVLGYLIKKGIIPIPKTSNFDTLKENHDACFVNLSPEIIKKLEELPKDYRYNNPPFAPKWNGE